MSNEKLSALISLCVASIIIVMNFYPWYLMTYNGKPKIQAWGKLLLYICALALFLAVILLFK